MDILIIILVLIAGYIIGSLPTAFLMARFRKGVDIRDIGSRNMGAMNVFYKIGFAEGITVLIVDMGKGALAVAIAYLLRSQFEFPLLIQLLTGVAVILGHAFPVFLKFRGGKGGATCIGVLAFLIPWACPFYLGIFLLLLAITRFPTLSYGIAFITFPLVAWLVYHSTPLIIFSVVILLVPLLMYIPRLKEMYSNAGGSWQRVFMRRNLKDRL
jgi:glycerol-3-phosphate acyltransferase PlsY